MHSGYHNAFLTELFHAGKPLVEIHISPAEGADIHGIAERLHGIAPDVELRQSRYGSDALEGDATAEAMERLFGFKLRRVNIPKWDAGRQVYDGVHEEGFMWESGIDWTSTPPELEGQIRAVGYSQPGTNDNGQPDTVSYELPPLIYEVSRMDDHGTTYPVASVFSKEEADRRIKELESSAHKQTYFIATRQPGEKVRHTPPTKIGEVVVAFPSSLPEQERIVTTPALLTEETQRLARLYERKHAALEALQKSLLHQAFTGEL